MITITNTTVTKRVKNIKQPRGGYLRKNQFEVLTFEDGREIRTNGVTAPSLIGSAVDYLTRWQAGAELTEAFRISLLGAASRDLRMNLCSDEPDREKEYANELLKEMTGLDDRSIINACKLAGYDVCYRNPFSEYKPVQDIQPNQADIDNVRIMVERNLSFFNAHGPIVKVGFTLEGGYTDIISSGDGDYLTADALWDLKVSSREPLKEHTLQLLVYYIMGLHSVHPEFNGVKKLGIFNPRLNTAYTVDIATIPQETMDAVSREVIGYK